MNQVILLIIGFVCGAGATLIILWSLSPRRKEQVMPDEKEQLIREISGMIAEADSIVTQWHSTALSPASFVITLPQKIDIINRNLKLCMSRLDSYFVKFVEGQLDKYESLIEKAAAMPGVADAVSKMIEDQKKNETVPERMEMVQPAIESPVPRKMDDDEFGSATRADGPVAVEEKTGFEDMQKKAEEPEPAKIVAPEPVKEVEKQQVVETEVGETKAPEELGDQLSAEMKDEEFAMETLMDVDVSKLPFGVSRREDEISAVPEVKKVPAGEDKAVDKERVEQRPVRDDVDETPTLDQHKELREEELLETIMIKPEPLKEVSKEKTQAPKKPAQKEPVKQSGKKPSEETEEETGTPPTLLAVEPEEDERKKKPEAPEEEKKDVHITGDDVVDKIDAFFGFNK